MPVSRAMGPAEAMRARARVTREALLNMVIVGEDWRRSDVDGVTRRRKQENLLKIESRSLPLLYTSKDSRNFIPTHVYASCDPC